MKTLSDYEKAGPYRSLAENSLDFIVRFDHELRHRYVNPALLRFTGLSLEEYIGKTNEDLGMPADEVAFWHAHLRRVFEEAAPHTFEFATDIDGTRRYFQARVIPEFDDAGQVETVLSIVRDISDLKQTEQELRQMQALLEQRVAERTQALQAVNRELEDFAYIVSHDLKAPLRGITQIATWLQDDHAAQLDATAQNLLTLLAERTRSMHALIEGLLHYSRIGREEDAKQRIDLNTLLATVLKSLVIPDSITIHLPQTWPTLYADPIRMRQIFQNLVGNAVKFMDKPAGFVRITWRETPTHWEFSVADNGPGIEAKYFDQIFQLFQTLAQHPQENSTGIGLALVKRIVSRYDGFIEVSSVLGAGTTFTFTLARAATQPPTTPPDKPDSSLEDDP